MIIDGLAEFLRTKSKLHIQTWLRNRSDCYLTAQDPAYNYHIRLSITESGILWVRIRTIKTSAPDHHSNKNDGRCIPLNDPTSLDQLWGFIRKQFRPRQHLRGGLSDKRYHQYLICPK